MSQLVDQLTIDPLPPDFDAGGFSCSQLDVDKYLATSALTDELAGVTRTYVVRDGAELVAYVSVLCDAIEVDREERPTDHPGAPALKLGLMGVRKDYQKRRYEDRTIGLWLLDWVVGLARSIAVQAGLRYVTLDSLPEKRLIDWYSSYGFKDNVGETLARKILKLARAKSRTVKGKTLEEIDLPSVSMRYDILLKE